MNYVQEITTRLDAIVKLPSELNNLYALLVLVKGLATTLEDVHDAWAIWQNVSKPDHKSLIVFNDLSLEVQELDRKYMEAIHAVALDMQPVKQ